MMTPVDTDVTTATGKPLMPPRQTYTIAEAASILGISRSSAYECARRGELPVVRLGRRLIVSAATLRRLLEDPTAIARTE